ncbi:hypothetical protein PPERSA_02928 [Pseudocohnilembus persalinus]|uniref:Uncharacterized protein n=1 Tax=Pseudocohnilembus persalinus TaxID=266149 RepID=A0A0V0R6Q5_PSEPJ|nr:hypothetical protein PPERSA_02928 [Pseudocohnilembus persalinus]|eukprot:KRX10189.1 hypothetical protein PPERSA_02928 [Pseudocohnilembus persalinus]
MKQNQKSSQNQKQYPEIIAEIKLQGQLVYDLKTLVSQQISEFQARSQQINKIQEQIDLISEKEIKIKKIQEQKIERQEKIIYHSNSALKEFKQTRKISEDFTNQDKINPNKSVMNFDRQGINKSPKNNNQIKNNFIYNSNQKPKKKQQFFKFSPTKNQFQKSNSQASFDEFHNINAQNKYQKNLTLKQYNSQQCQHFLNQQNIDHLSISNIYEKQKQQQQQQEQNEFINLQNKNLNQFYYQQQQQLQKNLQQNDYYNNQKDQKILEIVENHSSSTYSGNNSQNLYSLVSPNSISQKNYDNSYSENSHESSYYNQYYVVLQ